VTPGAPTWSPNRSPESGSASTGKPVASASPRIASREGVGSSAGPQTISPDSADPMVSTSRALSAADSSERPRVAVANGPSRPRAASGASSAQFGGRSPSTGIGSSGFRNGTFRWTGPGGVPVLVWTARETVVRSERTFRASASGSGSVRYERTASP